jgi:hypothetical protein
MANWKNIKEWDERPGDGQTILVFREDIGIQVGVYNVKEGYDPYVDLDWNSIPFSEISHFAYIDKPLDV